MTQGAMWARGCATISADGVYRYTLEREVGPEPRRALWVMLNPSTADAAADDPTIRRVMDFTARLKCGIAAVVNLFAFRATDPLALKEAADPIGPDNTTHIATEAQRAHMIIAAWGSHGRMRKRNLEVYALLRTYKPTVFSLEGKGGEMVTGNGQPFHPLMLRKDARLLTLRMGSTQGDFHGTPVPEVGLP